MPVTISISESDVLASLRALILSLVSCEVVKGLGNRVPMPIDPFICLTPALQQRLSTNVVTYDNLTDPDSPAWQYQKQSLQYSIQVDCYGPQSSDWAAVITTVLRSEYATSQFEADGFEIQPLYAEDPRQLPLVDGEQQYEQRWTFAAVLQCNPVVSLPMQFFDEAVVGLVEVDAAYPATS